MHCAAPPAVEIALRAPHKGAPHTGAPPHRPGGRYGSGSSSGAAGAEAVSARLRRALWLLLALCPCTSANAADAAPAPHGETRLRALADDELSGVRGADGIAFNLNNFSLVSSATSGLSLTYLSPTGSALTLSRLDLARTDDADAFADPYQLTLVARAGRPDMIDLEFPLNTLGAQKWSLTADFANCDGYSAGACTGSNFLGGTLQVSGLTMKGGGLTIATPALANTQGIAFGLSTQLDIASLAVYSRGRSAGAAADSLDASDALTLTGIHLVDASTGGVWKLADLAAHPGLLNAQTDALGSYLHLQIGWPTTTDPVPTAALRIDNLSFTSTVAGVSSTTNLGASSIASLQINYLDVKLRTGP